MGISIIDDLEICGFWRWKVDLSYTNETLYSVKKKKKGSNNWDGFEDDFNGQIQISFSILDFAGSKKIVIYVCLFSKQVKLKPNYRHIY